VCDSVCALTCACVCTCSVCSSTSANQPDVGTSYPIITRARPLGAAAIKAAATKDTYNHPKLCTACDGSRLVFTLSSPPSCVCTHPPHVLGPPPFCAFCVTRWLCLLCNIFSGLSSARAAILSGTRRVLGGIMMYACKNACQPPFPPLFRISSFQNAPPLRTFQSCGRLYITDAPSARTLMPNSASIVRTP